MTPAQNTAAYIQGFEDGKRTAKAEIKRELANQENLIPSNSTELEKQKYCDCENKSQCWEPCGELGHSAEHVKVHQSEQCEPDYKALWEQMCERCDWLDKELAIYTERKPLTDELLSALDRIVKTVPAQDGNGGFIVDHHDMDGEYLGTQQIDPMWVVQEMAAIAHNALEAHGIKGQP